MSVVECLENAYKRIQYKDNWCQDALARTFDGFEVYPRDDEAVAFCALGAIMADGVTDVTLTAACVLFRTVLNDQFINVKSKTLERWNDDSRRTHTEILDAYVRAIEFQRRREQE